MRGRFYCRFLETVNRQIQPRVDEIVQKTAFDAAAWAAVTAPYDTGALSASIIAVKTGAMRARVNVGQEYGIYQEFGTRYMAGRPFLRPAVKDHEDAFLAAIRSVIT